MTRISILVALTASLSAAAVQAADAPAEIKLGTLYASSGRFASLSMPLHYGLKLWIDQKNAEGGVYAKAFDKKIPVKLIAYDDQSNTATAATLYSQLITQDKVDILAADYGAPLTSVAVPIARDHKMLLINQTGLDASFFTADNPYIVLIDEPVYRVWPKPLADFLTHDGPGLGIKRVAILHATNDFTGPLADALRKFIKNSNSGLEIVFDQGVPTETSNYTAVLNFGMSLKEYSAAWHKKYADLQLEFNFNSVAGYTTGLVLEKALATAASLDQLELRKAILSLSGQLKTLDGSFELEPATGAQIGELSPIGQLVPGENDHLKLVTVWPPDVANGKPIYPRP